MSRALVRFDLPRRRSATRRKDRREWRRHAKALVRSGLPERAAVWRKRARNG